MSKKVELTENDDVNILVVKNGKVKAVVMEKEKLDAIKFLIFGSVDHLIKTDKTQSDFIEFIGMGDWVE